MRYFVEIAFDGTNYHGWQINPPHLTLSETIQNKLSLLLREKVKIYGCTRTDAGVHAISYFFHFDGEVNDFNDIAYRLNSILPHDIIVKRIYPVRDDAHARFSAITRTYIYVITNEKSPFLIRYALFTEKLPEIDFLNECSSFLTGEHDFRSFQTTGSPTLTSLVNVIKCQWHLTHISFPCMNGAIKIPEIKALVFEIEANRFLYMMVRNIVGTMLAMYHRNERPQKIKEILEAKDRKRAYAPAPANALFLLSVKYPQEIFDV